jgi:hypothetical protein
MTPDTTLDDFRRAQVLFDADRPAEAARLLDEVLAADPGSTATLERQGRAAEADALPRVSAAVARLSAGLLDQLDYEEAELLPALGRLGVPG